MSFLPTTVYRSLYVSQNGSDTNEGSITNPLATISGALKAAENYPEGDNIVIEVGPGTYSDDITVTRYNTYIKSTSNRYEQRAVTVTGKTLINYTGPQDKYNRIIGFQGIFFNHNSLTNPTLHISGSRNLTYLKDCYLASNGANTLKIENVTTASAKVVIGNCAFLGQKGGADLINIAGGDIKIDTVEAYFSPGSTGVGNGIFQIGNSLVAADRVLVDLSSTITGSAVVNGSTNYTGRPTLYLSNSSLGSTQATTNGAIYSTNVSYLWNVTLTDNSKIKGNNTPQNPFSAVLYSNLTSTNTLNFETISRSYYLKNYTGDVVANSFTGSFAGSAAGLTGLTGSNWAGGASKFNLDIRSLFSGSNGILYDTGSGVISAVSVFNGAETSGSITGSGVSGNPIKLKDSIEVVSITASAGFYGTASYALNLANTGSFAKKAELNQFTAENWFYEDIQLRNASLLLQTINQVLPTGDVIIDSNTNMAPGTGGGDVYVNGGSVYVQAGGSVSVDPGGHFTGSGAGITGLTGSNWADGANKFRTDIRGFLSGGSGINYDKSTGIIESTFNPADYVTKVDADSTYAFVHQTNTFDAVQEITVNSALPALRVEQTSEGGAIAAFYSTASYPIPTIIDEYGNVAIKTTTVKQIPQNRSGANPPPIKFYTLNVKGGVYQEDPNSVGVQQNGPIGGLMPMIARNNNTTTQISNPNSPYYIYNSTGRLGLFARSNALVNVIPSRWNAEDDPSQDPAKIYYYEVRQMNDYGSSPDFLFRIENNGETIFKNVSGSNIFTISEQGNVVAAGSGTFTSDVQINGDTFIDGYTEIGGDTQITGRVTSFTGFTGDGAELTNLTASNITNFTRDTRYQFNPGTGINIDYDNGLIIATGLTGGLASKTNITGNGIFPNEFNLVDDITVTTINATTFIGALNGTASAATNAFRLGNILASDYARLSVANTFQADQNIQGTLTASLVTSSMFEGDGSGLINLSGSQFPVWSDDVRYQFIEGAGIQINYATGEIKATGVVSGLLSTGSITGSGKLGEEFDLKQDISISSVTASNGFSGDLFGTADEAKNATTLGYNSVSYYASKTVVNTFNGAGTNTFNTKVDINADTKITSNLEVHNNTDLYDNLKITSFSPSVDGTTNIFGGVITASYPGTGSLIIKGGKVTSTSDGFFGIGSGLTNLSASQFPNWDIDVSSSLVAGANIYFTDNAGKLQINSSGGGGGGSIYTTGSITGTGLVGQEIRLKDDIEVVTITGSGAHFNYVDFETGSLTVPSNVLGRVFYDTVTSDLQYQLGGNNTVNLGQQLVQKVQSGLTAGQILSKGTVVHIYESSGNGRTPKVKPADVSTDKLSANTIGVAMNDIDAGGIGYVLLQGVLQNVAVPNAYNPGDILYLNGSNGGFSSDRTYAPDHLVSIGQVLKSGQNGTGVIYVKVQNGYELDELHDVRITNKNDGDLLTWDSGSQYWKNSKTLSGSYNISGGLNIIGDITSSVGFYSPPGIVSDITVQTALSASTILDNNVARRNTSNTFISPLNTFNGTTTFNGPVNFNSVQTSFNSLTASNAYVSNDLYVNGTASIAFLETREQQSLQVGDKYITILTGSNNHIDLDGAGILWGSGSTDGTTGDQQSVAYMLYRGVGQASDYLEAFPAFRVSGSLTASADSYIEGSLTVSNSVSASIYYGDGSSLTGVNAVSSNNTVTTITTTNTNGTINIGSAVSFSGSYLCAADQANDRMSNVIGIVSSIEGDTYTITTSGQVSGSNGGDFIGGDIVYVGSNGLLSNYDNIPVGAYITQVGIASLDASTTGNILLQPRIYGQK